MRFGLDIFRLGRALSHPGIDPREWVALARVEDTDDSSRWVDGLGWVIDCEVYGGNWDGEGDIPARQVASVSGASAGAFYPPARGGEVVLLFPTGDPEAAPVVVGCLSNQAPDGKSAAPTMVNSLPIDGEIDESTDAAASPNDTEIVVSLHNRREQWAGLVYRQSDGVHTIQGSQVVLYGTDGEDAVLLGSAEASESVVRGDTQLAALLSFIDGSSPDGPPPPVPGALLGLLTKVGTAISALDPTVATDVATLTATWSSSVRPGLIEALSGRVKVD